jgi:hypothetical protein
MPAKMTRREFLKLAGYGRAARSFSICFGGGAGRCRKNLPGTKKTQSPFHA